MDGSDYFSHNYKLGYTLGEGSFGKVKIAEHVLTGYKVAIKIFDRLKINSMEIEKVIREIKIMRLFSHPHIIRLYEVIETPTHIYVVMENMERGELYDYVGEQGKLKEDEARKFFQQIISGVECCHRNMIVHRDLKLENLLLDSNLNVKIADFGLSNFKRDGHLLKTTCGTPYYAAPEVLSGKPYSGCEVDVWSCGVTLYALLCGTLPFDDSNFSILFKKIKGGIYKLPICLSASARDLIIRMLTVDPEKRITIPEICMHPWFQAHLPRYLAVPPPNTTQQTKKIDEEVIQKVIRMGFEWVSNLLHSSEIMPSATSQLPVMEYEEVGSRQFPVDREWVLGLQVRTDNPAYCYRSQLIRQSFIHEESRAPPVEIMTEVLKAFQVLNIGWQRIGQYNMMCQRSHGRSKNESLVNNDLGDDSSIIENDNVSQPLDVVVFKMQLYKTCEEKYLLDIQRVDGPPSLFLELCAAILDLLWVP